VNPSINSIKLECNKERRKDVIKVGTDFKRRKVGPRLAIPVIGGQAPAQALINKQRIKGFPVWHDG